jgi:hypothetical protein
MERFLRKLLEKVGAEADGLVGKESPGLTPATLIPMLYQAIESNLSDDQHGVRRVAPSQIILALSYEVHSQTDPDVLEALKPELADMVQTYIRDHRYMLKSGLELEVVCDPFLRKPLEVRVRHAVTAKAPAKRWLQAPDDRTIGLNFGEPQAQRLTLGRAGDNDIVVDDPSVSRFHASLTINQHGEIVVSDLGSANGTTINGHRVSAAQVLRRDDELGLGSVKFIFKQE